VRRPLETEEPLPDLDREGDEEPGGEESLRSMEGMSSTRDFLSTAFPDEETESV
jgi:hypothetical protein